VDDDIHEQGDDGPLAVDVEGLPRRAHRVTADEQGAQDVHKASVGEPCLDVVEVGPEALGHGAQRRGGQDAVDVLLSPNEYLAASEHDNWELAVVTCALDDDPDLSWFTANDIRSVSTVALYRYRLDPSNG
jgi:hypothetical protein